MILSFSVGTSKNKTIDHRVKKTCAILQVTYEIEDISTFQQYHVVYIFVFYVFYRNLEEKDHIKEI